MASRGDVLAYVTARARWVDVVLRVTLVIRDDIYLILARWLAQSQKSCAFGCLRLIPASICKR